MSNTSNAVVAGTSNPPGSGKEIDTDPRRWVDALPLLPHAIKLAIMAELWLSYGQG